MKLSTHQTYALIATATSLEGQAEAGQVTCSTVTCSTTAQQVTCSPQGVLPQRGEKEMRIRLMSALSTCHARPTGLKIKVDYLAGKSRPVAAYTTAIDLAAAVAVLHATGRVQLRPGVAFVGELSLGGSIRPVRGVLQTFEAI